MPEDVDHIENRDLLATCWTWGGNSAPAVGDGASPIGITERLAAVQAAGWSGVGIVHGDLRSILREFDLATLKSMLDDHGLTTVELEFISNWWTTGALRKESDLVRHELFDAAAALDAKTIKIGAELQSFGVENPVEMPHFQKAFDQIATDAGTHGVRVAMEPMPMSNVRTIAAGAELVKTVGNPHGGLVIDAWHVARGGTGYDELSSILPMDHVFVVELDDAAREVHGSLWEDTVNHRLLPGDGDIDTAAFVAAMHRAGWRGHWGVEIISDTHRALPVEEATRIAADKTMATLDAAEALLSGR